MKCETLATSLYWFLWPFHLELGSQCDWLCTFCIAKGLTYMGSCTTVLIHVCCRLFVVFCPWKISWFLAVAKCLISYNSIVQTVSRNDILFRRMLSPVGRNVQFCRDYYGLPLSGIGQITKALAWSTFYRMMLCILHSVDYAVAKSPSVCPSVCLFVCSSVSVSHIRRYCAEMAKRIVKLFQLGYPHHSSFFHSSFPTETFYRGGGASNAGRYEKCRFSTNISLYLENNTR